MRFFFVMPMLTAITFAAGVKTENITLRSGKDAVQAHCFRPERKGPFPAVIVLHGDFGLTAWVKKQARRLADKGYVTLAVDLYRGELPKDVEEAHILERALPEERVLRDLKAAADYLASRADVRKDRLGVIGWDMGGGYALEGAIHDARFRAAVVCYGRLATDSKRLSKLNGSVLGIFAGKDEGISSDTRKRFENAMRKAGKRLAGLHVFNGVDNGFMDPDSPYREETPSAAAVAEAWNRIDAYLAAELKGK
jgi:carboxymethylenebutenolidase